MQYSRLNAVNAAIRRLNPVRAVCFLAKTRLTLFFFPDKCREQVFYSG